MTTPTNGTFRRLMALLAFLIPAAAGLCRVNDNARETDGQSTVGEVVYRHYV